jgi:hypothetical protein
MGPYAPLTDHNEIDYWTADREIYAPLYNTWQPILFTGGGTMATTTGDQYVVKINLWLSGEASNTTYNAWYACSEYNDNRSNSFDGNKLTDTPQEVSFIFPISPRCNLKNSPVTAFGLNGNHGSSYPVGIKFLASDSNPVPNGGVGLCCQNDYIEDYDVKAEIWTSDVDVKGATPVLIIPGVMGSDIYQGDSKLWANPLAMAFGDDDSFMDSLQFDNSLKSLDGALKTGDIVMSPVKGSHFYDLLIEEFKSQGYIEGDGSDATLFTFPYDWRYGVSGIMPNGQHVSDLLGQKIKDIMKQTGSDKVDVVAHSTGGLIVKKYIMDNPGASNLGKVVFVGVPNLGSVKAIKVFLQGDNFGIFFLNQAEMQFLGKNFPVVYDLSPSQQYFNLSGSYVSIRKPGLLFDDVKDLNYSQTNDFLINDHNLNSAALSNAQSLHSAEFDNFDINSSGVDFYNIVGCKSPTIGKVTEYRSAESVDPLYGMPGEVSGDGTVPVLSANSLLTNDGHKFYAVMADHGKMPSQDGIRQQIVNVISGSSLPVGNSIVTDSSKCNLKGRFLGLFSPVSISATDQNGNYSGLASDGSIQNDIPGADYQIWGEHKFVFLPTDEGQVYNVKLAGTGTGTFTLEDQSIDGDKVIKTQKFSNIPVTPDLTGQVNLGGDAGQVTLSLVNTPGSDPVILNPDSPENQTPPNNETPPAATSSPQEIIPASGGGGGSWPYPPAPMISATSTSGSVPEAGQVLGESAPLLIHPDGSLVVDNTGTVYLILNSVKHPFTSAKKFLQLGFKFKNVVPIFPGDSQYMLGMPM